MARIVFVVAMLAVTIYAAADWHRTPEDEMPGKIAKPIWLLIILFTATIAAIGPIAWLVLRWVSRAETKQTRAPEAPKRPSAPDDDPEFLFRLERDIQRQAPRGRAPARRNSVSTPRKREQAPPRIPATRPTEQLTPSASGTTLLRRDGGRGTDARRPGQRGLPDQLCQRRRSACESPGVMSFAIATRSAAGSA